jgi:small subunit ribosomal protein S13
MTFDFFNIKINEQKELNSAFKFVFGINYGKTNQLYKLLGLNSRTKWNLEQLNVNQVYKIKLYFPDLILFDSDLKRLISNEKEKFLELKCYKRNRFLLSLPVNGQRTRSNSKTRKKLKN